MPTPSLLIVPARFKSGKLYSQIPTSGAGDFTVTRNTAARRFDSAGLVASVASGIPRLDYYTSGGVTGCPALLVEPAATNLAFNSQVWDENNNWRTTAAGNYSVVINTTGTTAPDGTQTANAFSPTSGNTTHFTVSNQTTAISFSSGTIYTQSAFFKKGTGVAGRYVQLTFTGPGIFAQGGYANYDLELGSVAVVSGTSADTNRNARIENYGNGWYRCIFTATCPTSGFTGSGVNFYLITSSGSTRAPSFSGTTSDIVYAWGAQVETGSVATSYIPTTTGSVTRNADVISVTGAVSGSIGQTEGTIYAEVVLSRVNTNAILSLNDGTANNRFIIQFFSSTVLLADIRVAGNANYSVTIPAIPANGGIYKVALGYKANDYCFALNGTTYASTAVRGVPATTQVNLGNYLSSNQFNDRIRAVALYTTRLSNAQLAALTTP